MRLMPAPEIVKLTVSLDDLARRNLLQPLASAAASAARRRRSCSRFQAAVVAVMALSLSAQVTWSAQCKPHHFRAPYFIKTMGRCGFDQATMSFHGDGVEQARCLMRGMDETRNLGPQMAMMPAPLADRVGNEAGLPTREALSSYLSKLDLEWDFAQYLWLPISRANDNDPTAPMARYLVIHDTSGPNFGHRAFPEEVDNGNSKINSLNKLVFGRLGQGACRHQPFRRHAAQSRTGDSLARDQIRAGGEFLRRAERPLPACRVDSAAALFRPRSPQRCAKPQSGFHARTV